jgi:fido (protein-threonine AMPylation protein)
MHPPDCPGWEYKHVVNHVDVLRAVTAKLVKALRSRSFDAAPFVGDTRKIHLDLFIDLTPHEDHKYLAGHYRGENYRCLKYRAVGIRSDPRVGCPPEHVLGNMTLFSRDLLSLISSLDAAFKVPNSLLSQKDKLKYAVIAVCKHFEFFLRIHPYANGNGHIARFFVIAILGRYGFWLTDFPLEPRPKEPDYSNAIVAYRNGNRSLLEEFILSRISA